MDSIETTRRRLVIGLDALAVGLAILSGVILDAGGVIFQIGRIYISLRTPVRTMLWLGVVFITRLVVDRDIGPFGLSAAPRDADPLFAAASAGLWRRTAVASIGIGVALALL